MSFGVLLGALSVFWTTSAVFQLLYVLSGCRLKNFMAGHGRASCFCQYDYTSMTSKNAPKNESATIWPILLPLFTMRGVAGDPGSTRCGWKMRSRLAATYCTIRMLGWPLLMLQRAQKVETPDQSFLAYLVCCALFCSALSGCRRAPVGLCLFLTLSMCACTHAGPSASFFVCVYT